MIKKISQNISKLQNTLLFICATLLLGIIITLGWINHFDFERSVVNAELRELLIIAKSAGHDIENGIIGIKQEPAYIDKLIQHINNEEKFATFVMNNKHIVLSSPIKRQVGKNIIEIGREILNNKEMHKLSRFVQKLDSNDSGTAILLFPAKSESSKKEMKLFAFTHLKGKTGIYSIVVTERLSALTGPLRRNLRDILVLVGLFFLISLIFIYIFYHGHQKRIKMEISAKALEIINRELHCTIDDYKCIEKKLNDYKK